MVRTRVLGKGVAPLERTLGIGCFLDGYTSGEIILKFFPRLTGYLWIFPRTDHLAVGICGPAGSARGETLRPEMERFLVDLYGVAVLRRLRRYGAIIPSLPPGTRARSLCQLMGHAPAAAGSLALRVLERLLARQPLHPPPTLTSLPG